MEEQEHSTAAPTAPMTFEQLMVRYGELTMEKRALGKQETALNKELALLERAILDRWADTDTDGASVGGFALFKTEHLYAKVLSDRVTAAKVLREHGLGYLVSEDFNLQSVSSYFREAKEQGEHIPEALLKHFDITPTDKVGVSRKTKKKG